MQARARLTVNDNPAAPAAVSALACKNLLRGKPGLSGLSQEPFISSPCRWCLFHNVVIATLCVNNYAKYPVNVNDSLGLRFSRVSLSASRSVENHDQSSTNARHGELRRPASLDRTTAKSPLRVLGIQALTVILPVVTLPGLEENSPEFSRSP